MPEPVTLILSGAAIGAAAGKFVEKAWDLGEKWLSKYFEDHHEEAKAKAKENSKDFLNKLAEKIDILEKEKEENKEKINQALSNPDFSILLQKAMLSSAQTENTSKHELLSRLISDRLIRNSESIHALTAKLACDAISSMTSRQMTILGLSSALRHISPSNILYHEIKTKEEFDDFTINWLNSLTLNLIDWYIEELDLEHLEALSCITIMRVGSTDFKSLLKEKFSHQVYKFDYEIFSKSKLGNILIPLWNHYYKRFALTSVGQLIGFYVIDIKNDANTVLSSDWN